MSQDKDLFANVPEFLAAFANIRDNGFFQDFELKVQGFDGEVTNCFMRITGYVPNDAQYAAAGCGVLFEPEQIIKTIRSLGEQREIRRIAVDVETENWALWDDAEEEVIGSKGMCTTLNLNILFDRP